MQKLKPQRHGEVILLPVDAIPEGALLQEEVLSHVVGHSETGHHHILEATKPLKIFTWNGDKYIEVPELSKLWHQKTGGAVHRTQEIPKGTFKINIKEEFDYFTNLIRKVRD